MKKSIFLICLMFSCTFIFSQKIEKIKGNRDVVGKKYDLDDFNAIQIYGDLDVSYSTGNSKNSYYLKTDSNLHDYIDFTITNKILKISPSAKITSNKKLKIELRAKEINSIELNDKAELNQNGSVSVTNNFSFSAKDDSKFKVDIKAGKIDFNLSNNADGKAMIKSDTINMILGDEIDFLCNIKSKYIDLQMYNDAELSIKGTADVIKATLAGKPYFKGKKLMTKTASITQNNSSKATITCSSQITIFLEDQSKLYLYGVPEVIVKGMKGTSQIIKKRQ